MLVTTPLSYLDSFGDGVGGQAVTHPADLRFVYLSRGWGGGETTRSRLWPCWFCHQCSSSRESEFREAHSGPSPGSETQPPVPSSHSQAAEQHLLPRAWARLLGCVRRTCLCTLLLKSSVKKKSKRQVVRSRLCCIMVKIFFGIHRMIRLIHWTFARFLLEKFWLYQWQK